MVSSSRLIRPNIALRTTNVAVWNRMIPSLCLTRGLKSFASVTPRCFSSGPSPDLYTPDSSIQSAKELVKNLETVSLSESRSDPQVIQRYMVKALELASMNKLGARDFFQILHSLTRIEPSVWKSNSEDSIVNCLDSLLNDLHRKLKRSTRFLKTLTHIDITIGLTSLVKLRDVPKKHLVTSLAQSLYEEVPSRISVFDDHHFGQILNSMWRLEIHDTVIAQEIIRELVHHRDVSMFNPQSIVVLSSSISRIPLPESPDLNSLWNSLLVGATRIDPHKMQPKWPHVLLDSFSFSKIPTVPAQTEFVSKMIKLILKSHDTDERAIVRLVTTLKRIGLSEAEALRKISSQIKRARKT